jgi:hypothetical protein
VNAVQGPTAPAPGQDIIALVSRFRGIIPSLVINGAIPLIVYAVLQQRLHDEALVLVIGGLIPTVFTLFELVRSRRLDAIGAISIAGFAFTLLITVVSHGNPLLIKLQPVFFSGPLGLICLGSVVVGRPLHLVLMQALAGKNATASRIMANPDRRRNSTIATLLIAAMFCAHAASIAVLALTLPTAAFLAISQPVGYATFGAGVLGLFLLGTRLRRQTASRTADEAREQ